MAKYEEINESLKEMVTYIVPWPEQKFLSCNDCENPATFSLSYGKKGKIPKTSMLYCYEHLQALGKLLLTVKEKENG